MGTQYSHRGGLCLTIHWKKVQMHNAYTHIVTIPSLHLLTRLGDLVVEAVG